MTSRQIAGAPFEGVVYVQSKKYSRPPAYLNIRIAGYHGAGCVGDDLSQYY